jgi:hypothetical protein
MQESIDLQFWVEWKQRCALGLCSQETICGLRRFAEIRFRHFLRKYVHRTNLGHDQSLPVATDAWHLFETHLTLKTSGQGKQYKDWLFARLQNSSDPPLAVIQGGATLLMRDVVREHLRKEFSPSTVQSLNQPCVNEGFEFTLEDLLPGRLDPAREAEQREFEKLARVGANTFFEQMNQRERIGFLAKQLDIPLAHPAVQTAAGCGKSMVHAAFRDAVIRLAARLHTDFAQDDPGAVRCLTVMTLGEINTLVLDWANSEKTCVSLFWIAGGGSSEARRRGAT